MKATRNNKGHRWTHEEASRLKDLWIEGKSYDDISEVIGVTRFAIMRMVARMRKEGVPLPRRTRGNYAGRHNQLWSQGEVEYLVRRRQERATTEQIGIELQRTFQSVQGMIAKLRTLGVDVPMLGCGVRKKWDPEQLKATMVGQNVIRLEDCYAAESRVSGL